jgi:hypothetical protein
MFNINEFKSVMNKYGGPAKSNLFIMSLGPGLRDSRKSEFMPKSDLKFFCSEVSVPAVNIAVTSYRANAIDIAQSIPTNLSSPQINATFMLDSDHRVISFFHSWMQEIINYDISQGYSSQINGDHMPYEIGYKQDYSCNLFIKHYKTDSTGNVEEGYEYTFFDAFPTELGGKTLSWSPSDSIATVTVNFSASAYKFDASDPGTITSTSARGNGGYVDFLNSVGYKGQTVQQSIVPRSVQDAINTFTTVRNDFRTLKNTFTTLRNIF